METYWYFIGAVIALVIVVAVAVWLFIKINDMF